MLFITFSYHIFKSYSTPKFSNTHFFWNMIIWPGIISELERHSSIKLDIENQVLSTLEAQETNRRTFLENMVAPGNKTT